MAEAVFFCAIWPLQVNLIVGFNEWVRTKIMIAWQNWNICDGKCATGIFKTFGGKFPTLLFQTEKVRNFFSLMWKKSDENLLIYEVWKMCDDYLLHCGRFATKDFCMLEKVWRSQIVQYCDGKCATVTNCPILWWKMCDGHHTKSIKAFLFVGKCATVTNSQIL